MFLYIICLLKTWWENKTMKKSSTSILLIQFWLIFVSLFGFVRFRLGVCVWVGLKYWMHAVWARNVCWFEQHWEYYFLGQTFSGIVSHLNLSVLLFIILDIGGLSRLLVGCFLCCLYLCKITLGKIPNSSKTKSLISIVSFRPLQLLDLHPQDTWIRTKW